MEDKNNTKKNKEKEMRTSSEDFENRNQGEKEGLSIPGGSILTPSGLIMLSLAIIFDITAGIIIFIFHFFTIGPIISIFVHLAGFTFFGIWIYFRSGNVSKELAKKIGKKILKRGGTAYVASIIPVIGDFIPCWTIAVFYELKNS